MKHFSKNNGFWIGETQIESQNSPNTIAYKDYPPSTAIEMVQVAGSLESKKQVHDAEKPSKDKHTIALEAIDALQTANSPFVNSQIIARMLQNLIVSLLISNFISL